MVFSTICEQQRRQPPFETILSLPGDSYTDLSPYNHPVSIVGSVPIQQGGYRIQNAGNYLSIADHPIFNLSNRNFLMEFEFKTTTIATSTKEIYFLSQDDVEQNSFRLRLTSLNSISSAFDGSGYSGAVPNTAFYSSYQKFTWTRKRSVSNANFSALNFYYNDILFRSHNISSTMTPPDSTAIMALGRFTTGTADYVVKNIKIGIWND